MSIEEDIKVLNEIAEGFEKLSAEVCARTDLRAMWEGREKGIRQAIALIKAHLKGQSNDPLTPEQLLEMGGEPVWICDLDGSDGMWALVDLEYEFCRTAKGGLAIFDTYGKTWIAYRRRPEEATE